MNVLSGREFKSRQLHYKRQLRCKLHRNCRFFYCSTWHIAAGEAILSNLFNKVVGEIDSTLAVLLMPNPSLVNTVIDWSISGRHALLL